MHVFPTSGITRQYTTNPGFASETDVGAGIGPHDTIFYHVLDRLFFWDGTDFAAAAPETQIQVQNNPPSIPDTIVGGHTGEQTGSLDPPRNRIGSAMPNGDFHSHVSFQLEPYQAEPPPPPEFGAYGVKLSVATSATGIEASEPVFVVFNFGLDDATFHLGIEAFLELLQGPGLLGDFNENGELDTADLDLQAIAMAGDDHPQEFDLNDDDLVNFDDRLVWVNDLKHTWIGDANLDGVFSSGDMVQVFVQGKYETDQAAAWGEGDWNGDTFFGSADMVAAFVAGGYEQGKPSRAAVSEVPEPNSLTPLLLGLSILLGRVSATRKLTNPERDATMTGPWRLIAARQHHLGRAAV